MGNSGYSRAMVVSRADAAVKKADEAIEETKKLRADLDEHQKASYPERLLERRIISGDLMRDHIAPIEALMRAGFWARLWWFVTGRLPGPEPSHTVTEAEARERIANARVVNGRLV